MLSDVLVKAFHRWIVHQLRCFRIRTINHVMELGSGFTAAECFHFQHGLAIGVAHPSAADLDCGRAIAAGRLCLPADQLLVAWLSHAGSLHLRFSAACTGKAHQRNRC